MKKFHDGSRRLPTPKNGTHANDWCFFGSYAENFERVRKNSLPNRIARHTLRPVQANPRSDRHLKSPIYVLAAVILTGLIGGGGTMRAARAAGMPLPLKVAGTRILNSNNEPVLLRGVNAASMEWTSNGEGHIPKSVNTAIQEWRVNIIRLPLAQDRWFGKAPEQKDDGAAYRALVKAVVDTCATQACYIALDLHWSDCGEWGTNIAQHSMPDQNSVTFWKDCAAAYRNHPAVIFDLYNEPHDVTWDIWLKGGTVTDRPNSRRGGSPRTYEAIGMQKLLDTVRATGAKNLVIAGGLDWAYDFSGILDGRRLSDPEGNGVLYANHAYNNKGHSVETWIKRMEQATTKLPVIVSEYGGYGGPNRRAPRFGAPARASNPNGDDWLLHVMQALQDYQWSWVAWDFHPSAGPTLISGWDYTPTPDFGVFVKQALTGTLPRYTPPAASPSPGAKAVSDK
jgi:cellulase (glycosyl hydrolase family 5)